MGACLCVAGLRSVSGILFGAGVCSIPSHSRCGVWEMVCWRAALVRYITLVNRCRVSVGIAKCFSAVK